MFIWVKIKKVKKVIFFGTRLSWELCVIWNWRNDSGRIKDMAARTLLLKLEQRKLITLPLETTLNVDETGGAFHSWYDIHDRNTTLKISLSAP